LTRRQEIEAVAPSSGLQPVTISVRSRDGP